jgi:hypothetical protein
MPGCVAPPPSQLSQLSPNERRFICR